MADYKVNNNFDDAWENPRELPEQILDNRSNNEVKGQMHFTLRDIFTNEIGYQDIIQEEIYNKKALTPEMTWNGSAAPEQPADVGLIRESDGMTVNIEHGDEDARKFAIYRSEIGESIDYNNPDNMVGIVYNKGDSVSFFDGEVDSEQLYTYGVTSLSKTGVESIDATEVNEGNITQMKNRVGILLDEGEIVDGTTARMIDMQLTAINHFAGTGKEDKAAKHMNNLKQLIDVMQDQEMISDKANSILQQYAGYLLGGWQ